VTGETDHGFEAPRERRLHDHPPIDGREPTARGGEIKLEQRMRW
jgi:hypothetical protein